jgi:hypothetical protein
MEDLTDGVSFLLWFYAGKKMTYWRADIVSFFKHRLKFIKKNYSKSAEIKSFV